LPPQRQIIGYTIFCILSIRVYITQKAVSGREQTFLFPLRKGLETLFRTPYVGALRGRGHKKIFQLPIKQKLCRIFVQNVKKIIIKIEQIRKNV
jgi:hypothetical protein